MGEKDNAKLHTTVLPKSTENHRIRDRTKMSDTLIDKKQHRRTRMGKPSVRKQGAGICLWIAMVTRTKQQGIPITKTKKGIAQSRAIDEKAGKQR